MRLISRHVVVLITGVSGVGKSTLVRELRRRGYRAYDADDDGFTEPGTDGRWKWRVDMVRSFFEDNADQEAFFAGCSDEQRLFDFGFRVLLTAPTELIMDRIGSRSTNSFGKDPVERDLVLCDIEEVLPLLRKSADLQVDTSTPVDEVADTIIRNMLGTGLLADRPDGPG